MTGSLAPTAWALPGNRAAVHYASTMEPEVTLRTLTTDDLSAVLALELDEGQDKFVAPNEYTLAEAYLALTTDEFTPRVYGIFLGAAVVGLIAIAHQPAENTGEEPFYEMYRFMIDRRHQRRGIGRRALEQTVEILRTKPLGPGSHVATSFVPGNDVARALYLQVGFRETGELDEDEIVAVLPL